MKNKWYLDSGCSRHMTGDPSQFLSLMPLDGGTVTFGDNGKGIGEIGNKSISFDDVWYVDGLKHNLLSISQLCDRMLNVVFFKSHCKIIDSRNDQVLFVGKRLKNVYVIDLHDIDANICLTSISHDDTWLWHRRLGHASMSVISKLLKHDLVDGLPKVNVNIDSVCDACMKGKQTRVSFKTKKCISTNRPLELLHMDLFGPMCTLSIGGKSYVLVVVDDYSRFTWVAFLAHKNDALHAFKCLYKKLQNEKSLTIVSIRSDHGGEFENNDFEDFCIEHGIDHNFSAPRTPQQNGVVERKNCTIEDMARTMICENDLPKSFWAEAVATSCYLLNRVMVRPILNKTPYEIYKGRKPKISYFRAFGCKCFVLNNGKDSLGKFDSKSDEGIFVGYSTSSKAYHMYNKHTKVVEESIHVVFDVTNPICFRKSCNDDDVDAIGKQIKDINLKEDNTKEAQDEKNEEGKHEEVQQKHELREPTFPRERSYVKGNEILGDPSKGPAMEENRMCRKPVEPAAEMVNRLYRVGSRKLSQLS
ncbi:hypothetical protein SLEP1_g26391 [Rubroshorea leprosula]|uniref:Integrase catalytic domain-containing protein n=1 Tax=Rubroshorea leprosula TaxID=152421 RepID=A0AAV5JT53_9ROSI|nr:hypothetical protein SLEP1_g26391 [Rubroshorea leprosula]